VERVKVALLQAKRLYPDETMSRSEDMEIDYLVGFGRLLHSESEFKSAIKERTFHFSEQSQYRALEYRGEQYKRVLEYQKQERIPVHYCLNNPLRVPRSATIPIVAPEPAIQEPCEVGCRIVSTIQLDLGLKSSRKPAGYNPSYSDLLAVTAGDEASKGGGWSLEHFVVDLVIGCAEGYVAGNEDPTRDRGLFRVFGGRTAPISAAISITIDAPAG
jgi:hypothetical protein